MALPIGARSPQLMQRKKTLVTTLATTSRDNSSDNLGDNLGDNLSDKRIVRFAQEWSIF